MSIASTTLTNCQNYLFNLIYISIAISFILVVEKYGKNGEDQIVFLVSSTPQTQVFVECIYGMLNTVGEQTTFVMLCSSVLHLSTYNSAQ